MASHETDPRAVSEPTHWMLRAMDSDLAWWGLGWLRPARKTDRMTLASVVVLALVTSVPLILIAWLVWSLSIPSPLQAELAGRLFLALAMPTNIVLQFHGAAAWNERAARLAR